MGPFTADAPGARWGSAAGARRRSALRRTGRPGVLLRGEFRPGGVEREFAIPRSCASLRRRSLARLRREVEPVGRRRSAASCRRGRASVGARSGHDRLLEVITPARGLPDAGLHPGARRPAGARPRLQPPPARRARRRRRGGVGRRAARSAATTAASRSIRRDRAELLASAGAFEPGERPTRPAPRRHPRSSSSDAAPRSSATAHGRARRPQRRELLDALWDLVWSGEVTNDTFAAAPRAVASALTVARHRGPAAGRHGAAACRRSLVAVRRPGGRGRSPTERGHATAVALLERHGVVTREAVLAEGLAGGFASVYPVLKRDGGAGRVRRGYFVDGLGAAQFALPGAVDRLRAERDDGRERPAGAVLAAADPAQPYGATLPWPRGRGSDRCPCSVPPAPTW